VKLEEKILDIADEVTAYEHTRELRVIAVKVRKMAERIKRLEEAGDNLESKKIPTIEDRKAWRKAKEAKL
jgi:uncharacterized protein Yka (UPF0111/DUF47 family)